jgi:methylmalonyl-CoA mutase
MVRAIAAGVPKRHIEEAAARRQARIDSGQDVILGVNRDRPSLGAAGLDTLEVDNSAVRNAQVRRLAELRASRDGAACARALAALREGARGGANLLALAVDAARAGATVGEISQAMEDVFGRHDAVPQAISGVYAEGAAAMRAFHEVQALTAEFERREGRRPRILVGKMGQDGHDRGAKVIATAFADLGFDVDIGPLFQTPREVAAQAVENDVHIVGISSLAGSHKALIPELVEELRRLGRGDILVVAGGVIPRKDHAALLAAGCAAVFGPGTVIPDAARHLLELLMADG